MEHTILIAFTVEGETRQDAMSSLGEGLKELGRLTADNPFGVTSYWMAEDDRIDGSDCDSAVFVSPGAQRAASLALHTGGFTPVCNIVERNVLGGFEWPEP